MMYTMNTAPDFAFLREYFVPRRGWQIKLGIKDGDRAFALAWKRVLSGEVSLGGPVLASDGRRVQAMRNEAKGFLALGESEENWLRGLVAEAASKVDNEYDEDWVSIIGFSAMLGVPRDGDDPIAANVSALWRTMEAQGHAVYRGDSLYTGYAISPRSRGRSDTVWLRPGEARDLACEVLSRTHIEVSEDWLTSRQAADRLGIDVARQTEWPRFAAMIDSGTPFEIRGRPVPAAIRRAVVVPGATTECVAVVHGSGLPEIARGLGLPDPERYAPSATVPIPSTPPKSPKAKRELLEQREARIAYERKSLPSASPDQLGPPEPWLMPVERPSAEDGGAAPSSEWDHARRRRTFPLDFIARDKPPVPGEVRTGARLWDGGPGRVQLLDESGRPWAVAFGKGDPIYGDSFSKLTAAMGANEYARTIGDAIVGAVDLPYRGADIPDGSEAMFIRFYETTECAVGDQARRSMNHVARATDPNHLYAVWGHGSLGLMGRNRADRDLIVDLADAFRAGTVAACGSWQTGLVLVLADRIDHDASIKDVLSTVKAQVRQHKKEGYARVACPPPEGPIVYQP